jgi:hypothetical protein
MVTLSTDITQDSYNKLNQLPLLPYNIVSYLIQNNELIWKILAYNDANCWKNDSTHPNLTNEQKGQLVYDGIKKVTDCRVFLDTGQDYVWTEILSILRISILDFSPSNKVYGYVSIGIEAYAHYQISTLSNYQVRTDTMVQSVISTLNGADVQGLGRLYFDARPSGKARIATIGQSPYKGKLAVMCNWIT